MGLINLSIMKRNKEIFGIKKINSRAVLYVGGLDTSITEEILSNIFNSFGKTKYIHIPWDKKNNKHRGFGFIEFEEEDDAVTAIDNMHSAELKGKVIRVNYARPPTIKGGFKGWADKPIWADVDSWLEKQKSDILTA